MPSVPSRRAAPLAVLLVAVLAWSLILPRTARAEIGSYLLFDMADGTIIAEHRPTAVWYPASITKLMTAYVTFEEVREGRLAMTSPVRISPQAYDQPPSRLGLKVGTVLTIETALRIILTKSANDVSLALAEAVGGTQANFMAMMNAAADAIGMVDTHFDNPHGLPNRKQVTTARDVALLMMALADRFPEYGDFFTMGGVQLGSRGMINYNSLIRRFEGADGMKTGFICSSGFNLAATATRGGTRLGAVVLGGLTSRQRDERTAELLHKGFEAIGSGGVVRLDGFGDPMARSDVVPVAGVRGDLGTVRALRPAVEPDAHDIRAKVCGARRPTTRYSAGVASTRAAFEEQKAAYEAWRATVAERTRRRVAALSAPFVVAAGSAARQDVPPDERSFADDALLPDGWVPPSASPSARGLPAPHPTREGPERLLMARTLSPDLVGSDWASESPYALPWPNPLAAYDELRAPLPEPPPMQPLSYLSAARPYTPVTLSLGGADPTRPDPMSGPVVGGGKPPLPERKPVNEHAAIAIDAETSRDRADDPRGVAADSTGG